ncbi:MAG TPA: hypothetical protein EYQ00_04125 [Dehalococcoidia bacterium]|nr:hypothetical protein [Dehalococcoidia bacterium]
MGQTISKARGHFITRPIQRFNIESRTDKLLQREKPVQAPRFESDRQLLEEIRRDRPDIAKAAMSKDEALHGRLQRVFVTSEDPEIFDPDINRRMPENPNRPLPGHGMRSRMKPGFSEAAKLTAAHRREGKLTIDEMIDSLGEYSNNPTSKKAEEMAEQYKYNFAFNQFRFRVLLTAG